MKNISLKLPDDLAAQLAARARKLRRSKSAVVRDLLEQGLSGDHGKRRVSCLDLAGDLVGCLQGPGDLSYNKNHMRGYGQ
jgi:plasmid stability protein